MVTLFLGSVATGFGFALGVIVLFLPLMLMNKKPAPMQQEVIDYWNECLAIQERALSESARFHRCMTSLIEEKGCAATR